MAKFIISNEAEIYTTHGPVRANVIYDSFINKKLNDDFKIAGFFNAGEVLSSIKDMQELECEVGVHSSFKAIGIQPINMICYPEQRAMTSDGKFIKIEDTNPGDLLLSLNGLLEVDYIEIFNDETKEDNHLYYIIETNNALPTLYVNNLIIMPTVEVDVKNPFFENYQFI